MCTCDQDGECLDLAEVEFNEIPSVRPWTLSIPLASFKAPAGKAKKLPRKLKKKLKKQAYSLGITELQSDNFAAHNHLLAWSHLAENQRQRAADMYATIRKNLDDTLAVSVPGVFNTEAIAKIIAETVDSLKPHAEDPKDIKVEQDKDNPNVYHFTYKMRVQMPPAYKVTITKPADVSDEDWNEWTAAMKAEVDLINAQNDEFKPLTAAEEAEEAALRG